MAKHKIDQKRWTMPEWMEPFRESIVNTGGNSVEDLMNDRSNVVINAPLAMLAVAVHSQVTLLTVLRKKGMV